MIPNGNAESPLNSIHTLLEDILLYLIISMSY